MLSIRGADGIQYYVIDFDIDVTFFSGSTKFQMLHNGTCYGEVDTEYAYAEQDQRSEPVCSHGKRWGFPACRPFFKQHKRIPLLLKPTT